MALQCVIIQPFYHSGPPFIHSINASETSSSVILDCWTSGEPEPSVIFTHQGQDVTLNFEGHWIVGSMLYIDKDAVMPSYVCVAENRNGEDQKVVSGKTLWGLVKVNSLPASVVC